MPAMAFTMVLVFAVRPTPLQFGLSEITEQRDSTLFGQDSNNTRSAMRHQEKLCKFFFSVKVCCLTLV